MDTLDTNAETGNPYKCKLTVLSPPGKGHALGCIISKLTHWVDPSQQVVCVEERSSSDLNKIGMKNSMNLRGCLVTPALSVMLYMREAGKMCVKDIQRLLKKPPWKFHHKVELQQRNSPKTVVGKHEFYKLGDDLPLFAACPILSENEHLRINMYVHNFTAMVDFYRIITDTEIETHKPEFCIFQLYQQPGLDIQLSLKRSQYIFPVPVESAYVSFNIRNIAAILGIGQEVTHIGGNVFTTRDPDGNLVVIYETVDKTPQEAHCGLANSFCSHENACLAPGTSRLMNSSVSFDDLKSLKSVKSHDSGRYSDMDGLSMDNALSVLDNETRPKPKQATKREKTDVSEASEGYESSSNISNNGTLVDDWSTNRKGKGPVKGKAIVKGKGKTGIEQATKDHTNETVDAHKDDNNSKHGNITPVYI